MTDAIRLVDDSRSQSKPPSERGETLRFQLHQQIGMPRTVTDATIGNLRQFSGSQRPS
jgi:hypothetical protein